MGSPNRAAREIGRVSAIEIGQVIRSRREARSAMLNAAGFATASQRLVALAGLAALDVADQRRSDG